MGGESFIELRWVEGKLLGSGVAQQLVAAAKASVGHHQGHIYERQVRCVCEDLDVLSRRIRVLDDEIGNLLDKHEVA